MNTEPTENSHKNLRPEMHTTKKMHHSGVGIVEKIRDKKFDLNFANVFLITIEIILFLLFILMSTDKNIVAMIIIGGLFIINLVLVIYYSNKKRNLDNYIEKIENDYKNW